MIFTNILQTVGNTPIVCLNHFGGFDNNQIYLKLEGGNPTHSIKDRAAIYIIEQAEATGKLKPGDTLIESTSGNFGKSLAMIAAVRGYKTIIVIDPKTPRETINYFRSFGVKLEIVVEPDPVGGFQMARYKRAQELLKITPRSFWTDQYGNPDNPRVHELITAQEIISDFTQLDAVVSSVSTGGHLSGVAKTLGKHYPNIDIMAVDAVGSSIFGPKYQPYKLNGIGLGWQPPNLKKEYINKLIYVSDIDAFSTARILAVKEGIMIGGSGGAVLYGCLSYSYKNRNRHQKILGIIPDAGANYLSTFYDEDWILRNDLNLYFDIRELYNNVALSADTIINLK